MDVDEIALAARGGDSAALETLIRAVRPRVFRWALVQTRSPDEAEDIVQEVATVVFRRLNHFKGGSFAAWLYRVTANVVNDTRRSWLRRRTVRWSDAAEQAEGPVHQGPLEALIGQELGETVGRFLRELPRRQREVLDLVDMQGYSAVEAAEMLEMESATARVHLLRARRALRQRLIEEADDEV